jgi:hypothetical protein
LLLILFSLVVTLMNKIEGRTFTGTDIRLDGNSYENCSFSTCRFLFDGADGFNLNRNSIATDCTFVFGGAAGTTLNALRAIYSMGPLGRSAVIAAFRQIAPDLKNLF